MTLQELLQSIRTFIYKKFDITVYINDLVIDEEASHCLYINPMPSKYKVEDDIARYDYLFKAKGSDSIEFEAIVLELMGQGYVDDSDYVIDEIEDGVFQTVLTVKVQLVDTYSSVSLTEYKAGDGIAISPNHVISLDTDAVVTRLELDAQMDILRAEMGVMETDLQDYADARVTLITQEEYDLLPIKDSKIKYFIID